MRHLRENRHDGVSPAEYDVLYNIHRSPGRALRLRELNRHLLLTQPSVSRLIDRLVARGLVAKCADPDDARGAVVSLTDDGHRLFRRVGTEHARLVADRMLGALTPVELRELGRLSDALRGGAAPDVPKERIDDRDDRATR